MDKSRLSADDALLLNTIVQDYANGPAIYHASELWKLINGENIRWLGEDGVQNFKRSVNNNYFNWMVGSKRDYFATMFRHLFQDYLKSLVRNPFRLRLLFSGRIGDIKCRTLLYENCEPDRLAKDIYRIYLVLLYDYVVQTDPFGFFESLQEPEVGNPIVCRYKNKSISQDICNSYLEYAYIAQSLGQNFQKVGSIAEIGAGYGRLMYVFRKLHPGIKLIVVDIPPALFVAQWYLESVFPDSRMMKYRGFESFSEVKQEFEESDVCFFLPHQMELLPDKAIDLVINVSSFHEMKLAQVNHYYGLIDEKASFFFTKQWLSWENPIDHQIVPAVIYPTRPHWRSIAFRLNPIQREFFEALFELHPLS